MKQTITPTASATPIAIPTFTFTLTAQPRVNHYEPFINAQQAAVALNLPLYYFVNTYKRAKMGVPFYCINRLVRYRLNELHKWQVALSAQLAQAGSMDPKTSGCAGSEGGAHA